MVKAKKAGRASAHISHESDNEELQDEVDAFHKMKTKVDTSLIRKRNKKRLEPEEVLNVEADASDSSDHTDESDFDDEDVNDVTVSSNQWGKKRKDFYGTGYVDEDWGGMREEELEEAALEEEDALERQKKLDGSTAAIADLFDDDEEDEESEKVESVQVTNKKDFNCINFEAANKKTRKLLDVYTMRKKAFEIVIEPLGDVVAQLPECGLKSQIAFVINTYTTVLVNLAFYLKLKAKQIAEKSLKDDLVELHPVKETVKKLIPKIALADEFLLENADPLNLLKSWVKKDAAAKEASLDSLIQKFANIPLPKDGTKIPTFSVPEPVEKLDFTPVDSGDAKRKATKLIAENKTSGNQNKNKKAPKTSRTKNRKKVRTIEKKVKSQIGNVRKELQKYSGETKGIRASTIKSTKLVA